MFARVGVPGEARLAGVTGLTWGSFLNCQAPEVSSLSGLRLLRENHLASAAISRNQGNFFRSGLSVRGEDNRKESGACL